MTIVVRPCVRPLQRGHDAASVAASRLGGRLVEDQDRRVLEDRPGDRQPLPLAARERRAALADDRVVALRQARG